MKRPMGGFLYAFSGMSTVTVGKAKLQPSARTRSRICRFRQFLTLRNSRRDIDAAKQINAAVVEFVQCYADAVRQHIRVGLQQRSQLAAERFDLAARRIVGQADGKGPEAAGAAVAVLDVFGADL